MELAFLSLKISKKIENNSIKHFDNDDKNYFWLNCYLSMSTIVEVFKQNNSFWLLRLEINWAIDFWNVHLTVVGGYPTIFVVCPIIEILVFIKDPGSSCGDRTDESGGWLQVCIWLFKVFWGATSIIECHGHAKREKASSSQSRR